VVYAKHGLKRITVYGVNMATSINVNVDFDRMYHNMLQHIKPVKGNLVVGLEQPVEQYINYSFAVTNYCNKATINTNNEQAPSIELVKGKIVTYTIKAQSDNTIEQNTIYWQPIRETGQYDIQGEVIDRCAVAYYINLLPEEAIIANSSEPLTMGFSYTLVNGLVVYLHWQPKINLLCN